MSQFTANRAGRPSKGDRDAITVRMLASTKLKPRLEAVARARGDNVSDLAAELLEKSIDQAEREAGLHREAIFDLDEAG